MIFKVCKRIWSCGMRLKTFEILLSSPRKSCWLQAYSTKSFSIILIALLLNKTFKIVSSKCFFFQIYRIDGCNVWYNATFLTFASPPFNKKINHNNNDNSTKCNTLTTVRYSAIPERAAWFNLRAHSSATQQWTPRLPE